MQSSQFQQGPPKFSPFQKTVADKFLTVTEKAPPPDSSPPLSIRLPEKDFTKEWFPIADLSDSDSEFSEDDGHASSLTDLG